MESVERSLLVSRVPAANTRAAGGKVLLCTRTGWGNGNNEAAAAVQVYCECGVHAFYFRALQLIVGFFTPMFK